MVDRDLIFFVIQVLTVFFEAEERVEAYGFVVEFVHEDVTPVTVTIILFTEDAIVHL